MSIDAGTIYSSIRVRLGNLDADINGAIKKFDSLAEGINKSGKSVENLEKLGTKMSMTVTAPILAAAAASVKFASDYSESVGGVETVFGAFAGKIKSFADTAAKNAGLSMTEVNEAATVLGTSLQNAGYSMSDSADLTLELTQRAADMAALFGTDVPQAMDAIKAALRGEADPIEKFGVGLTEATLKTKALEKGIWSGKGEMTAYQKATARVALIMDQTARAQGRFAEEADGVGGKTKVTTAEVKNLAIKIGTDLLPVAKDILSAFEGIVGGLSDLDPETRKVIMVIAALAAGIGPAALGVASMTKAVNNLKGAFTLLAANPIGAALTAIAAGLVIVTAGAIENKKAMNELSGVSGLTVGQLARLKAAFEDTPTMDTYISAADMVEQLSSFLNIGKENVIAFALASQNVSVAFKEQLVTLRSRLEAEQDSAKSQSAYYQTQKGIAEGNAAIAAEAKKKAEQEAKAAQAIKDQQGATEQQIASRKAADKDYIASLQKISYQRANNLISETDEQQAKLDAAKEYLDVLYELGYASNLESGTIGQKTMGELVALVNEYNAKMAEQAGLYGTLQERIGKISEMQGEEKETALEKLYEEIEASDLLADKKRELVGLIEASTRATADQTQYVMKWQDVQEGAIKSVLSGFSALGQELAMGDAEWGDWAKFALTAMSAVLQSIGAELAAYAAKALIMSIFGNVAMAPGVGIAAAGSAAAYTAAGAAMGFAGKFEDGGIVPGNSFTGDKMVALVNSAEHIYTQEQDAKINRIVNAMDSGAFGETVIPITLLLDGKAVAKSTKRYTKTGKV